LILCVLASPVSLALGLCSAADGCTTCSGAFYGDARVPGAAPVFADLVGVVCKGACYIEASRWSTTSIQHGDTAVQDANECRRICASTPGCEVWTHIDTQCQLKRALDNHGFNPLVNASSDHVASAGASIVTGAATCTGQEMAQLLLPFPSGLDDVPAAGIGDEGISSPELDSWYNERGRPRCTSPVTLGSFFADGNFKPQGCYYEVFGISQAREHMRSKWMVISGGSNAILTAISVGNVMEPEGESLPADDSNSHKHAQVFSLAHAFREGGGGEREKQ
jgi:hypothetical protein